MKLRLVAILVIPALASCNDTSPASAPASSTPSLVIGAMPTPAALPAEAKNLVEENADFSLSYAYPAEVAAIPPLRTQMDGHIVRLRAELTKETKEERAQSAPDFVFHPHSRSFDWKIVTQIPGWLSLSTLASTYTGGAHPGYWFEAILWDKSANVERKVTDLFTSKEALGAAIRKDFCAEIDRQREKKRGAPVQRGDEGLFSDCIDPLGQVLILGSSDRKAFNRIGILVAPYEAGPYAEGSYEVTLPVTAKILALVKPDYRSSFAEKR